MFCQYSCQRSCTLSICTTVHLVKPNGLSLWSGSISAMCSSSHGINISSRPNPFECVGENFRVIEYRFRKGYLVDSLRTKLEKNEDRGQHLLTLHQRVRVVAVYVQWVVIYAHTHSGSNCLKTRKWKYEESLSICKFRRLSDFTWRQFLEFQWRRPSLICIANYILRGEYNGDILRQLILLVFQEWSMQLTTVKLME